MYIKIIATGEIVLCESTMSSDHGWYYKLDNGLYHESEVIACERQNPNN